MPLFDWLPPWQDSATAVVLIGAALSALAGIWTRWLGPFIARPVARTIGRAIRHELRELVEEVVTALLNSMLRRQGAIEADLAHLRRQLEELRRELDSHTHEGNPAE